MALTGTRNDSKKIRLVMVGKTGGGKSALGNTILRRKEFESKLSSNSVTQRTSWKEVTHGLIKIRIVDTPGLFDTGDLFNKKKDWLTNEILKSTIMSVPGPHAFLYVLQIGRLTDEDIKTAKKLFDLFGEKVYEYIIIVFTHAKVLDEEGMEFKEYTDKLSDYFAQLRQNCDNRILCVENKYTTEEKKQRFIDDLIVVVLKMNKNDYYTNKTIEDATHLFYPKVEEVKYTENVSHEQAEQIVLADVQEEGTFFKYLKSGSFGLTVAAVVGGVITFLTPAGAAVAVGVGGASGAVSAAAMVKDKCCIM